MNEQLQDFLNDCIDKGRNPFLEFTGSGSFTTHDLFSIESGIMEFVKWKQTGIALPGNLGHYMNMCQMTGEKKVKYFLENALLPN